MKAKALQVLQVEDNAGDVRLLRGMFGGEAKQACQARIYVWEVSVDSRCGVWFGLAFSYLPVPSNAWVGVVNTLCGNGGHCVLPRTSQSQPWLTSLRR
jgi:hypothetical protein